MPKKHPAVSVHEEAYDARYSPWACTLSVTCLGTDPEQISRYWRSSSKTNGKADLSARAQAWAGGDRAGYNAARAGCQSARLLRIPNRNNPSKAFQQSRNALIMPSQMEQWFVTGFSGLTVAKGPQAAAGLQSYVLWLPDKAERALQEISPNCKQAPK